MSIRRPVVSLKQLIHSVDQLAMVVKPAGVVDEVRYAQVSGGRARRGVGE